ncbi:TDT family transporter [Tsukamurella serpentis]
MQIPGLRTTAAAVWILAAILLALLTVGTAAHWIRYPEFARRHHRDPVIGNFYGAMAMAFLTVGIGAVLVGRDVLGLPAALTLGAALWVTGTALGLFFALFIPVMMIRGGHYRADAAFAGWLMPVVSPMVTAAGGAVLMPYTPEGATRSALLWFSYGCFAFTLFAALRVLPAVILRLLRGPAWAPAMMPTAWIVLGPLGQSITAANGLGSAAHLAVSPDLAAVLQRAAAGFGTIVTVAVLLWTAIALTLTARTALGSTDGLPYALTWWSFTFPIGTCATGFSAMDATGATGYAALALAYFLGLSAGWIVATRGTLPRALASGGLLRHPDLA